VSASESEADLDRDSASDGDQEGDREGNNDDVDEAESSEDEVEMVDGLDGGGAEPKAGDGICKTQRNRRHLAALLSWHISNPLYEKVLQ